MQYGHNAPLPGDRGARGRFGSGARLHPAVIDPARAQLWLAIGASLAAAGGLRWALGQRIGRKPPSTAP